MRPIKAYRDRVVIATKFGIRFDHPEQPGNHPLRHRLLSPEAIRESVESSLRRLRTDHIDLYYQHRIDKNVEPEVVADTMSELVKEGKILHSGISEATAEYLRRAHRVCPVAAVQNRYSMMARWHESLSPVCEELGVGFVAFSPLANGLLSKCSNTESMFDTQTDHRAAMPQYQKDRFREEQMSF